MKRRLSKSEALQRHRTPSEKAAMLREQRRSGLSLLAFARKHGLCYASLLRWRTRPRPEAGVAAPPDTEADPRFVPVRIESEAWSADYVLSWAGGRSLKIPPRFETESLRRLLRELEGVR